MFFFLRAFPPKPYTGFSPLPLSRKLTVKPKTVFLFRISMLQSINHALRPTSWSSKNRQTSCVHLKTVTVARNAPGPSALFLANELYPNVATQFVGVTWNCLPRAAGATWLAPLGKVPLWYWLPKLIEFRADVGETRKNCLICNRSYGCAESLTDVVRSWNILKCHGV
jgi:hypothetical protein